MDEKRSKVVVVKHLSFLLFTMGLDVMMAGSQMGSVTAMGHP